MVACFLLELDMLLIIFSHGRVPVVNLHVFFVYRIFRSQYVKDIIQAFIPIIGDMQSGVPCLVRKHKPHNVVLLEVIGIIA
jgi:hypothetical protein